MSNLQISLLVVWFVGIGVVALTAGKLLSIKQGN